MLVNTLINVLYLNSHSELRLEKNFIQSLTRWTKTKQRDLVKSQFVPKSCKLAIGVHLQFALNECIKGKTFPLKKKLAYVTSIFKIGDKLDSTDYRPISVTPRFAKFFERLLLTQMMDFIYKHTIINKEQFGFQKKRSATDAVLELIETVSSNLDQSTDTVAIFQDLAKAFNSISHNIFLRKLRCMVFPGSKRIPVFISCQPQTKGKT